MKNVEQFIQEHTRSDSNELCSIESRIGKEFVSYREWLTTDDARKVAVIAREETIEEVCEWLKKNVTYMHPRKEIEECVVNISKLKEDLGFYEN